MGLIETRVKQLDSFINDVLSHSKNLKLAITLDEIFRNLISNTIKYLNPHIEDPFASIDIVVTENAAIINFNDNGIGIAEGALPKVFEMFYRATEYSEGSGIGLYIVKNAIQKLGGEITIDSEIGVGTSFYIMIPNRKNEALSA